MTLSLITQNRAVFRTKNVHVGKVVRLSVGLPSESLRECWGPDRLRGLGDDNQEQEVSGRGS